MKVLDIKSYWSISSDDRKFSWIVLISMVVVMTILMIQNVIRYGIHDSYDPMISVIYLVVAFFSFLIWIPPGINQMKLILSVSPSKYWWKLGVIASAIILVHLFISGIMLHAFDYYDRYIFDPGYLKSYFGRIVLYHVILILSVGLYVKFGNPKPPIIKMITGSVGRKKVTVPSTSIEWIEADDHYARIYLRDQQILKRASLDELCKYLSPEFIRIHRKYLVNKAMITGKEKSNRSEFILLNNGTKLKVGPTYSPLSLEFKQARS